MIKDIEQKAYSALSLPSVAARLVIIPWLIPTELFINSNKLL